MPMDVGSAGPITFGGLQSGLDTAAIVDASVKVAQQPIRRLQRQQAIAQTHADTFGDMRELLMTLQKNLVPMQAPSTFSAATATSSDVGVVRVSAGSNAARGSHQIEVVTLARAQRTFSRPLDEAHGGHHLQPGTLEISVGASGPQRIDVDANTTLADVAEAINASGLPLHAAVIFDGTAHRLAVAGERTGAAHAITFVEHGVGLGLDRAENTAQAAQDASIVLDGLAAITRPDNTIGDVIEGVSLELMATSKVPQLVQVRLDTQSLVQQVTQFVEAYNAARTFVAAKTQFTGQTDPAKLVGDNTLNNLQRHMQASLHPSAGGRRDGAGATSLAQLGITQQRDGSLQLEAAQLAARVAETPDEVVALFAHGQGPADGGIAAKLNHVIERYAASGSGHLDARVKGLTQRTHNMQKQIDRIQTYVQKFEAMLRERYKRLEKSMAQIKHQNHYLEALKPQPQRRN